MKPVHHFRQKPNFLQHEDVVLQPLLRSKFITNSQITLDHITRLNHTIVQFWLKNLAEFQMYRLAFADVLYFSSLLSSSLALTGNRLVLRST